jgi:NTP pyrophosphatase (non-canonical NTP hydrolase)
MASSTCVACSAQAYTGIVYNDSEHTCSKNPHNSNVSTLHPCTGAITSRHSHYVEGKLTNLDSTNDTFTADSDPQSHSISGPGSSASAYTFDSYQDDAGTTAFYPEAGAGSERAVAYVILGLTGEAGEIANKWKKLLRDAPRLSDHPDEYYEYYDNLKNDVFNELGDVLWYAALLATELGTSLGEVAAANYTKLNDRKRRDALHGSGDDR